MWHERMTIGWLPTDNCRRTAPTRLGTDVLVSSNPYAPCAQLQLPLWLATSCASSNKGPQDRNMVRSNETDSTAG